MTSDNDNQRRERIEWLKHTMNYYGTYHHHKESMAWLATALYLPGIMYVAFQARHIADGCWIEKLLFSLGFFFASYIVSYFVKWQFKNRWKAHERVWYSKQDLEKAVFCNDEILHRLAKDWEIHKECKDYCIALKDIFLCKSCCKRGSLCKQLQPLESEVITYVAIAFITSIAIILVCVH